MSDPQPKVRGGLCAFSCITGCLVNTPPSMQVRTMMGREREAERIFKASETFSVASLLYFCGRNFQEKLFFSIHQNSPLRKSRLKQLTFCRKKKKTNNKETVLKNRPLSHGLAKFFRSGFLSKFMILSVIAWLLSRVSSGFKSQFQQVLITPPAAHWKSCSPHLPYSLHLYPQCMASSTSFLKPLLIRARILP